jgi:uroporphyrinogen-III synthase
VYASQAEDSAVVELIEALGQGRINTIAFTSEAQVDRLWQVAERASVRETLERGLARTYIAAVGPVVGAALERRGLTIDAMPDEPFALKPLMNAMIEAQQRMPSGS